jgi:short-subunit dehydrogenase
MSRREIRDSRAIVTGASSGIGRATALELARQGAEVVITARREERLQQVAQQIAAAGGRVQTVVGDLVEPAVRQAALQAAQTHFGGLDVLVNNAGVGALGLFEHSDSARLRRVMEVNFFALVEMTRLALPVLRQGTNPMVVNVSSILGHRGVPYSSEYGASKAAVLGFSEAIRAELSRHGIDVLVVSPGTTETEFFERVLERSGEPNWPKHAPVSSEMVARQIVRAIRAGKHEIIPYHWGRVLCWLNRLSPRLVDSIMTRYV